MNYRNSMIILIASQLAIVSILVDPSPNPVVTYGRAIGVIFITWDIFWPLVKDFYRMYKDMEDIDKMKKLGVTATEETE